MASTIMHYTVAVKLQKYLKINNINDYYLGSIAPDVGKLINVPKSITHFIEKDNVPNVESFIKKYPNYQNNDFLLGYFVHLYTDYIWFDDFISKLTYNNQIHFLDGTTKKYTDQYFKYVYHDYDILNEHIIKYHQLNIDIFYKPFIKPNAKMTEFDINKTYLQLNISRKFLENNTDNELLLFNLEMINNFIDQSVKEIIDYLERKHYEFIQ